ncbi:MAG: hypothetical protein U5K69_07120 [Balneolaceae bacterium]|nr:hypothetical protein [Balneolaceae bacterium]
MIDGELFYTENQGDWIGSGGLWHVEKGDFPVTLQVCDGQISPKSSA